MTVNLLLPGNIDALMHPYESARCQHPGCLKTDGRIVTNGQFVLPTIKAIPEYPATLATPRLFF